MLLLVTFTAAQAAPSQLSATPTYRELHEKMIVPKSLRCHSGNHAARQIFLENYDDLARLSVSGRPDQSLLYETLTPDAFTRMPMGAAPLNSAEMTYVREWIRLGLPR